MRASVELGIVSGKMEGTRHNIQCCQKGIGGINAKSPQKQRRVMSYVGVKVEGQRQNEQ